MLSVSRSLVLALTLTIAVALVGCGGDDEKTTSTTTTLPTATTPPPASTADSLGAAQFTALNKAAEQVVTDLSDIGKATTACAGSSKDAKKIGACVSGRLDKATTELNSLADEVRSVGNKVTGECQTSLKAFADDVEALGTSFGTAAKALLAGDSAKATATLKALPLDAVQTTGNAAQTACKPAK